jgi:hypothetical protein
MSDTARRAKSPTDGQSDESEEMCQMIMGETFIEPQEGLVEVDTRDAGSLVQLQIRTNGRGVKMMSLMTADEAQAVADKLSTVADEVAQEATDE